MPQIWWLYQLLGTLGKQCLYGWLGLRGVLNEPRNHRDLEFKNIVMLYYICKESLYLGL